MLTAFHTNSRGFKTTFDQLSAGKGLAFYDRHNSIETLLKGIIDLHKNILSYTTEILGCDPDLGPIFGPSTSLLLPLILLRLFTELH